MYVCRTFESTVTLVARRGEVEEDCSEGSKGECEMMPAPSLLADPSMPKHSMRLLGLVKGDCVCFLAIAVSRLSMKVRRRNDYLKVR